jgi:Arc/MetJ family transcription regulator
MKPLIERGNAAGKSRAFVFAQRLDRIDHARSAEEIAMTL